MNKLKWIPIEDEINVNYPMLYDINKNDVQYVYFDNNVVFMFINNYMVVLRLYLVETSVELKVANIFQLRSFLPNEHITKIINFSIILILFIIKNVIIYKLCL